MRSFWSAQRSRVLWEKSDEPSLVTAATLSVHAQKPLLKLNARVKSENTTFLLPGFDSSRALNVPSLLTETVQGLSTKLQRNTTSNPESLSLRLKDDRSPRILEFLGKDHFTVVCSVT